MHHGEFRDPRLVVVYDALCPWTREDDFFLSVLAEEPAERILDLGCGTGRLAIAMAKAGYRVTGVDPARASLDAARRKPGADALTWLDGSAEVLPPAAFDAALMTSHVAQFFVTGDEWAAALAGLHQALVPGARLIFDSRDPAARGWEKWNPADSCRLVQLPDGTTVTAWTEVLSVRDGAVSFSHHYGFADGDRRAATATLRFRGEDELRSSLAVAGFSVEQIYGGWNRDPIGHPDGEFLVVARRDESGGADLVGDDLG
jgi:SAM-dependent methyltransferase